MRKQQMIHNLTHSINIIFILCCIFSIALFYFSNNKPKRITAIIIIWSIIHSILAYVGFYLNAEAMPPRFSLILVPSLALIIYSLTRKSDWIIKNRNTKISTFLHTVRIPVELVLIQLFFLELIPELMTYEGRNYDILAGITAPIIGLLYLKKRINKKIMIVWNIIGLIMILFILINGILSAELPIQQFAFDQPNVAVNYFPFVLLPATIVPLVLWTHLSDLIMLFRVKEN